MGSIGDTSHVVLCEGISGTGSSVTYDSTKDYQYIKAKTPKIGIKFTAKVSHNHPHKSRRAPEIKLVQSYNVGDGKFLAKDVNSVTEWIVDAYIAKTAIYLLVDYPSSGSWYKKSWYNDSLTKVYYLKGYLQNLDITQDEGSVWKISFNFEECWAG